MTRFTNRLLPSLVLSILSVPAVGAAENTDLASAKSRIAERYPQIKVEHIHQSPIEGVLEVAMGGQIAYVTSDGRYLLQGDLVDLEANVNLSEQRRNKGRAELLAEVDEDSMIIFSPEKPEHTITVFTDVDCGYCRKLHQEMAELNEQGLRVRYLFFPRSGPQTPSWEKAERVWCADDRNAAITAAKADQPFESKPCEETPVREQWELGQAVGLRGTPAIVTEQGDLIAGYLPAAELAKRVESLANASAAVAQAD
ncbi:DsbC family protein [soil metagenome]